MTTLLKNLNGLPGPTRHWPLAPTPATPRPTRADALEQLKLLLLARTLATANDPTESLLARRAANEAASLAWALPYPLLVFPGLFEEKLQAARRIQAFQEIVRRRSLELAFAE
jgi:hypothetical protein